MQGGEGARRALWSRPHLCPRELERSPEERQRLLVPSRVHEQHREVVHYPHGALVVPPVRLLVHIQRPPIELVRPHVLACAVLQVAQIVEHLCSSHVGRADAVLVEHAQRTCPLTAQAVTHQLRGSSTSQLAAFYERVLWLSARW